jgi:hypothetical protein
MKKIIGIATILLMATGYAQAVDYWHFGVGVRVTGVITGKDYNNALGEGILLTFGNLNSRFTTQMDLDNWSVTYQKTNDTINVAPSDKPVHYRLRDYQYSGLGVGFLEKFRAIDFSSIFSTYIIGGLGGYFLDRKYEARGDAGDVSLKSTGLHSLLQLAGGLGFEGRLNQHWSSFIEGRYVKIIGGDMLDKDLMKGYFGVKYTF